MAKQHLFGGGGGEGVGVMTSFKTGKMGNLYNYLRTTVLDQGRMSQMQEETRLLREAVKDMHALPKLRGKQRTHILQKYIHAVNK